MALRVAVWQVFSAAASLIFLAPPVDAQTVAAVAPGQLPSVTVDSPEPVPRKRIRPVPRLARSARSTSVVQSSQPVAPPAANGATTGTASGPGNLQPTAAS